VPPDSRSITQIAWVTVAPRLRRSFVDIAICPPEVTTSSTMSRFLPDRSGPSASLHVPYFFCGDFVEELGVGFKLVFVEVFGGGCAGAQGELSGEVRGLVNALGKFGSGHIRSWVGYWVRTIVVKS